MAGELIAAGVDVGAMYRRIYEEIPAAKLELLCRALTSLKLYSDGRLAVASLLATDFAESGAEDSHSEGIIDHLRALSGVKVAMLIRELRGADGGTAQKVSMRATDNDVDVSAIARMHGGGGHRRAAGFTSDLPTPELIDAIRAQVSSAGRSGARRPHARSSDTAPGSTGILLADKPPGITSHDVVARARRALGTRKVGHAGTLDPFATGLLILLVGRATRLQRFFMELPKTYEVIARLGAARAPVTPKARSPRPGGHRASRSRSRWGQRASARRPIRRSRSLVSGPTFAHGAVKVSSCLSVRSRYTVGIACGARAIAWRCGSPARRAPTSAR